MTRTSPELALRLWLAWGRLIQRYHRYEVHGLEHLEGPAPKLIVGYHGRGFAHDLIALNEVLYRRRGKIPRSVVHAAFQHGRLRWFFDGLGALYGDSPELERAVQRGEHIIVAPGGAREANRSWRVRYRVDWGRRAGFIRLALKLKLPIVPVAAAGTDDTYIGVNDGYRLGKQLGLPYNKPLWVGVGPLGICPFSPPFPAKIIQLIGPPITLDPSIDPSDRDATIEQSLYIQQVVQRLLDHARAMR